MFFGKGSGNHIVDILSAIEELGFCNDAFARVLVDALMHNFDELNVSWATNALNSVSKLNCEDKAF